MGRGSPLANTFPTTYKSRRAFGEVQSKAPGHETSDRSLVNGIEMPIPGSIETMSEVPGKPPGG